MRKRTARAAEATRYGIGEWYGRSFVHLTAEERQAFAELQAIRKEERPVQVCPFRGGGCEPAACTKKGGVCSIRAYTCAPGTDEVLAAGPLCTTCPRRFEEDGAIYRWIGETVLGTEEPVVVGEIGFLQREDDADSQGREDVGRIENVLVHPTSDPLRWCALEIQAVYFSGDAMSAEFGVLRTYGGTKLPFPAGKRRPDHWTSGAEGLLPRLEAMVPTIRRWGVKVAVLLDEAFFASLGAMDNVGDVSNCDVAWFVVRYEEGEGQAHLTPHGVHLSTLERAVEGLVTRFATALTQADFETDIRARLAARDESRALCHA